MVLQYYQKVTSFNTFFRLSGWSFGTQSHTMHNCVVYVALGLLLFGDSVTGEEWSYHGKTGPDYVSL
jgi:hypothetical protein